MSPEGFDSSCPEQLLPSQWFAQNAPDFFDLPERRLLVALLMDALRALRSRKVKEQNAVVLWIRGRDARFTFFDVCDGLELDAKQVASHMLNDNRETPVPRRARWARKGQSTGRHRRVATGAGESAPTAPRLVTVVQPAEAESSEQQMSAHG